MTAVSRPRPAPAAPVGRKRSGALLLVLSGNMLIDALEVSLVLVALPAIARDLGLSLWGAQWVMSGFALGFAALLLPGRRITARFGLRGPYLAALLVFAAASVVAGTTQSTALLVAGRLVKGASAALTAPTGLAIIATVFPDGPERRRAIAVYSLFGAAGFTTGLLLSGALAELGWRWTLLLPAPVALVLAALAARHVPAAPGHPDQPARPLPARNARLLRSAAGAALLNGGYLGMLLLFTFGLHDRGWSPWRTALGLLPVCLPLTLSAPFTGWLIARVGAPRLIVCGALAAVAGYGCRLAAPPGAGYAAGCVPVLLLVGAAFVLSFGALNAQAVAAVPAEDRAAAVPLYQTGVQVGAVLMLCLTAVVRTAFTSERPAWALLTAVGALGLAVALTGLRPPICRRKESGP